MKTSFLFVFVLSRFMDVSFQLLLLGMYELIFYTLLIFN